MPLARRTADWWDRNEVLAAGLGLLYSTALVYRNNPNCSRHLAWSQRFIIATGSIRFRKRIRFQQLLRARNRRLPIDYVTFEMRGGNTHRTFQRAGRRGSSAVRAAEKSWTSASSSKSRGEFVRIHSRTGESDPDFAMATAALA